ncbi:MAG: peptidylprolyl isomerase [Algicola sp.]|nr:peptidylprolyl isomerase [Algicola sp.]
MTVPAQAEAEKKLPNIKGQYIQPDNLFPQVKMETSMGDIIIELDRSRAALTANNFLGYVARQQYDNTLIHRVEIDFVVQGGGFRTDYKELVLDKQIINESGNGLKNDIGRMSMARLTYPHTATSQWFFNLNDNTSLDPGRRWGYAVFGAIIEGEEVLEAMGKVEVDFDEKLGYPTVPKKMLIIKRVTILKPVPVPGVSK